MKGRKRWLVIANSAQARFLALTGKKRRRLEPLVELEDEESRSPSRDMVSDRPGRTFDSQGPGRHAMAPPTDPQLVAKQRFVAELAERLRSALDAGDYEELVLFAPPQTLGRLRSALEDRVRERVVAEHGKDLTNHRPHEILEQFPQP